MLAVNGSPASIFDVGALTQLMCTGLSGSLEQVFFHSGVDRSLEKLNHLRSLSK